MRELHVHSRDGQDEEGTVGVSTFCVCVCVCTVFQPVSKETGCNLVYRTRPFSHSVGSSGGGNGMIEPEPLSLFPMSHPELPVL